MNLLRLAVSKKDTYRIKEEVTLPGTKESIGQVLLTDVSVRKLDIRTGQDEILLRGEMLVFCMYLSAEEKPDWIEQSVPFEGRVLCDGVSENMYYHIQHSLEDMLADIRLDEDGEARQIAGSRYEYEEGITDYEESIRQEWFGQLENLLDGSRLVLTVGKGQDNPGNGQEALFPNGESLINN